MQHMTQVCLHKDEFEDKCLSALQHFMLATKIPESLLVGNHES